MYIDTFTRVIARTKRILKATANRFFVGRDHWKEKEKFNNKRRFAVGAGRLSIYIGESNAQVVFSKGEKLSDDKLRIKFRKHGIIDIYLQ